MFHYQTCFLLQICSLFNFYLAIELSLREVSYVLSRIRALAHLRALMTRKSCAIGMRNAILRNYLPAGITELRIHLLPGWGWGWRFCFTVYIARKLLMVLHVGWEDSPPLFEFSGSAPAVWFTEFRLVVLKCCIVPIQHRFYFVFHLVIVTDITHISSCFP